ncbi:MAG: SGNH/GDSL hydrolase family protein [Enterobacterales bacterium]|nr:SGNH/GDSL hydrolase family protein [Enterobacterales bacterium]
MVLRFFEKIAFLFCLFFQGLYVKWRIIKLPEAAGKRTGTDGDRSQPEISLLIIGDSAAAGVGADHQNNALLGNMVNLLSQQYRVNWRLWAKTGETTASKLKKLGNLDKPYDYVVVSLGVNDITTPIRQDTWLKQQTDLIALLQQHGQPRKIILSSLPPIQEFFALPNPLRHLMTRRAQRFTAALKRSVCDNSCIVVLDLPALDGDVLAMASDGFHPGPSVYKARASAATKIILNDLNS